MQYLSNFAERLKELMFDNGEMTAKALAAELGLPAPTITRYRKAHNLPSVKNLVLLADYFGCSTDFLLGKEADGKNLIFKTCPPFSERIVFLAKQLCKNYYEFYNKAGIPESTFFEWKNGESEPTIDSVIRIAEHFDCRIDYILGRE